MNHGAVASKNRDVAQSKHDTEAAQHFGIFSPEMTK
jgi:hypothetical protein